MSRTGEPATRGIFARLIGAEPPRGYTVLIITVLVTVFGTNILAPVLPLIAARFELSGSGAALLLSAYAAGRMVMSVPGGALTDRFGFGNTVVAALVVAAGAALVAALSPVFWVLLVAQLVQGLVSGVVITAGVAAVMTLAAADQVGRVVSVFQGAILAAMLFAPSVGGAAAELLGIPGPFWTLLALQLFGLALLGVALRRGIVPRRAAGRRPVHGAGRWPAVRGVVANRAFGIAFVAAVVMGLTMGGVRNTLVPLFADSAFALDSGAIGLVLTLAAAVGVLALVPSGRALDRFGRRPVIRLATLLVTATTAALALAAAPWMLVGLAMAAEFSKSLLNPTQSAVVADLATPETMATSVGFSRMASPFGLVMGPVIFGWFADLTGPRTAFLLAAALLGVLALVCQRMPETMQRPS